MARLRPAARVRSAWPRDFGTLDSLVLVFPLLILYHAGVAVVGVTNGLDYVSAPLLAVLHDPLAYMTFFGGCAAGYGAFLLLWPRRRPRASVLLRVGIESAIYALTAGTLIIFVMDQVLTLPLSMWQQGLQTTIAKNLILSLGAGVYEELIFRLALLSGLAWLFVRAGSRHGVAIASAVLVSSVAFAAAHHVGPGAEAWAVTTVVYRGLAGVVFAAIHLFRSTAHAVFTHFLYDFYVLTVIG